MVPMQLRVDQQYGFVAAALAGRRRVLEVGCGKGQLARRLAGDGFEVTAIDRELDGDGDHGDHHAHGGAGHRPAEIARPASPGRSQIDRSGATFVEADFLTYDAAPFDAVVFTNSLHHLATLPAAIERARALTTGIVVIDDFDVAAPDAATLRWYYRAQELLVAAELYPADRVDGGDEPLARWRDAHDHDLHTGDAMLAALATRFRVEATRGPYLYRYLCGGLPGDERAGRIAEHLLATETRGIAAGEFRAVGLRAVAVPDH